MRRLLLAIAILLLSAPAMAQQVGVSCVRGADNKCRGIQFAGDNQPRVVTMTYGDAIVHGLIAGHAAFRRFGINDNVGGAWETVSSISKIVPLLTSADTFYLTGTDAVDTAAAGTGCRTVQLQGLDASWDIVTSTVDMAGVGNTANFGTSFLIPLQLRCMTVGTGGFNAGLITLYQTTGPVSHMVMSAETGRSQSSRWAVPDGYKAKVEGFFASEGSSKGSSIALYAKFFGGAWEEIAPMKMLDSSTYVRFPYAIPFATKTVFEVRAKSALGSAKVTGWLFGHYEPE